ncbi:MAG: restriction endonuclease subunit S [Okeania sp. SIO2H7]|nr:restriction endonuclease subunit S [Okeania sp. SIO2H7]
MPIPPEIAELVERLNQELDETEQKATGGLNLVRLLLSQFPDNFILIQFFAYLNDVLLFVETTRRRIQSNVELISPADVDIEEIQEAGEDLGTLLGRIFEAKMQVEGIIARLEELQ